MQNEETRGIASERDVEAIEARGAPALPPSTYEMIRRGAAVDPDAPALSFFRTVDDHRRPETWTYRELVARITQTANFFHRVGATRDTVIALALPNLPETQFAIWGGQAAGIVMPLNPMLEPAALGALLDASDATILVTVAELWPRLRAGGGARGRAAARGARRRRERPGRAGARRAPRLRRDPAGGPVGAGQRSGLRRHGSLVLVRDRRDDGAAEAGDAEPRQRGGVRRRRRARARRRDRPGQGRALRPAAFPRERRPRHGAVAVLAGRARPPGDAAGIPRPGPRRAASGRSSSTTG